MRSNRTGRGQDLFVLEFRILSLSLSLPQLTHHHLRERAPCHKKSTEKGKVRVEASIHSSVNVCSLSLLVPVSLSLPPPWLVCVSVCVCVLWSVEDGCLIQWHDTTTTTTNNKCPSFLCKAAFHVLPQAVLTCSSAPSWGVGV